MEQFLEYDEIQLQPQEMQGLWIALGQPELYIFIVAPCIL